MLIFAGATETCTDIEIIDDIIVEGDEVFIVEISSPFIPLPIDISSAIVTIIDDDSEFKLATKTFFLLRFLSADIKLYICKQFLSQH